MCFSAPQMSGEIDRGLRGGDVARYISPSFGEAQKKILGESESLHRKTTTQQKQPLAAAATFPISSSLSCFFLYSHSLALPSKPSALTFRSHPLTIKHHINFRIRRRLLFDRPPSTTKKTLKGKGKRSRKRQQEKKKEKKLLPSLLSFCFFIPKLKKKWTPSPSRWRRTPMPGPQ